MNFQIKAFKEWNTNEGGGYQFNLYLNNKKFAWVHNDGNGGMIDMTFADSQSQWKDSPFKTVWNEYVKSLGQWKSAYGAINGKEYFDHDTDTAIGLLVEQYELNKARKKGTPFKLATDSIHGGFRVLNILDITQANAWLNQNYGEKGYILL